MKRMREKQELEITINLVVALMIIVIVIGLVITATIYKQGREPVKLKPVERDKTPSCCNPCEGNTICVVNERDCINCATNEVGGKR